MKYEQEYDDSLDEEVKFFAWSSCMVAVINTEAKKQLHRHGGNLSANDMHFHTTIAERLTPSVQRRLLSRLPVWCKSRSASSYLEVCSACRVREAYDLSRLLPALQSLALLLAQSWEKAAENWVCHGSERARGAQRRVLLGYSRVV